MLLGLTLPILGALLLGVPFTPQTPGGVVSDRDHAIVFEFGWEGDWSHAEGLHQGGTVAFEVTPVEHWLEIEVGGSAIHEASGSELSVDCLFKKPWTLSKTAEVMAGVGPEIIRATGPGSGTFFGISAALDLMFWPAKDVGWYLEPTYERTFRAGLPQNGMTISAGLLIGR